MKVRAAVLTPPGAAGIATILITGADSEKLLHQIILKKGDPASQLHFAVAGIPHYHHPQLSLHTIRQGEDIIDQVIVAPGQDGQSAEIHCHGGERIVERILLLLEGLGAQVVDWREIHSPRSIAEEVEYYLPWARTEMAVRVLAGQSPGGLASWASGAVERLKQNPNVVEKIKAECRRLLATYPRAQKLLHPPTVVLAGPVNAGKSTLANALSGGTQSIALDLAGTTRDWTESLVEIGGLAVRLVDTAGLREPGDAIEAEAIAAAQRQIAAAELIIFVCDGRDQAIADCGLRIADWKIEKSEDRSQKSEEKRLIVHNKADLLAAMEIKSGEIYVSSATGAGLAELKSLIVGKLGFKDFDPAEPLVFTGRQAGWLEKVEAADSVEMSRALRGLLEESD